MPSTKWSSVSLAQRALRRTDRSSGARHLRRGPHRLQGKPLQQRVDMLSGYELRGRQELRQLRPRRRTPCRKIEGLTSYAGYICLCSIAECDFATIRLEAIHGHVPRHRKRASQHSKGEPLWAGCTLQTYYTAKGLIDYFVVIEPEDTAQGFILDATAGAVGLSGPPLSSPERRMFDGLRESVRQADRDLDAKAAVIEDPGQGRADRERWLVYTGFPTHLPGLADAEIESSFRLPTSKSPLLEQRRTRRAERKVKGDDEGAEGGDGEDGRDGDQDLRRILAATEA